MDVVPVDRDDMSRIHTLMMQLWLAAGWCTEEEVDPWTLLDPTDIGSSASKKHQGDGKSVGKMGKIGDTSTICAAHTDV